MKHRHGDEPSDAIERSDEDPETLETIGPATFPGLSEEKWLAHTRYDAAQGRHSVPLNLSALKRPVLSPGFAVV